MTFDDIEIDLERFELRKAGAPVAIEPKVFDLIRYLAGNANKLVSKDDLIENVWQGRIVSDAALSSAIKSARRAMGETDLASSRIKTVRGRGFRMELPEIVAKQPATHVETKVIFTQPSLAVLAPKGAGDWGGEVQRRLTAAMGRVPFVTVAAPMLLREIGADGPAELLKALGPGFALDISVSKTGGQTVLDGMLFDTSTGETLWSFETPPFDPEHDVLRATRDLIVRLEPQVVRATYARLAGKPNPADPRALTLQALGTMSLKGWNRPAFVEAEELLRQAISQDDRLPFAYAALSLITALGQEVGMAEPAPERRQEAIELAGRAIDLDGMSSLILGFAGCALCDAGQALRGKTLLERALEIDAGNPQAKAALATQLMRENELDHGITLMTEAIEDSARDTKLAVWRSILAMAHLRQGDKDAALAEAKRAIAADDMTHLSRAVLAAIYMARGEVAAAKDAWSDALRVTPELTLAETKGLIGQRSVDGLAEILGT